jgi:twitching motility protein PilT
VQTPQPSNQPAREPSRRPGAVGEPGRVIPIRPEGQPAADEPPAQQAAAQEPTPAPATKKQPPVDLSTTQLSPRHKVEAWLAVMVKSGASDLILRAGGRPSTRVDGRIGFLPGRVPAAGALLEVLDGVLGPDKMDVWRETGSVDSALQLDGLGRFRLNAYKQMGEPAVVLRRVSDQAPVLEDLELPTTELTRTALRKRGMVLVTGVAGSGKSTTLAGLIQYMNLNAERHIVTLEDPIEILFAEKRCVISQREIGIDTPSFEEGLRHALRQSPDVILIGEMRDRATVNAALDASETGHLVLSTMHTVNAAQTVDRILGFFNAEQHAQIRQRLSDNMAGVLSQRLIARASGKGMVPAFEMMTQTPRIRELLEEGDTSELARTIEQGTTPGLISFNQSLRRLVQQKLVELKDALAASDRPDELVLALRGITSSHGRRRGEGGGSGGGPSLRLSGPGSE